MKRLFNSFLVLSLALTSCQEEPTLQESLNYIESELDGHAIFFYRDSRGSKEIQNISFNILDYEKCECEYIYTFYYNGEKSFKEIQKFNLMEATYANGYSGNLEIRISLSNESNESTVIPIESNVVKYEIRNKNEVMLYFRPEQEDRLIRAFEHSIKLCNEKIGKKYFEQ
ncbi:hypothetical protein [Aestuariivivens marinum]|uniref:hypothetical protein n=1 Tax=Aestuariivivens marinum TaxID=2913555 RepID=UPI001F583A7D|nr:hypothetical protein [Aestuariivivens marinum]